MEIADENLIPHSKEYDLDNISQNSMPFVSVYNDIGVQTIEKIEKLEDSDIDVGDSEPTQTGIASENPNFGLKLIVPETKNR